MVYRKLEYHTCLLKDIVFQNQLILFFPSNFYEQIHVPKIANKKINSSAKIGKNKIEINRYYILILQILYENNVSHVRIPI